MADVAEPEVKQEPEIDVSKQLLEMKQKMDDMENKYKSLETENAKHVSVISKFEENLAQELDKLNKPKGEIEDNPVATGGIDAVGIYDNLMKKRELEEAEFEKSKELSEIDKIKQENATLRFKNEITDLIKKEPFLEAVINEGIEEGRYKTIEDIKLVLTPSLKKALQNDYKIASEYRDSGRNPLERYDSIQTATNQELRSKRRERNLEILQKKIR